MLGIWKNWCRLCAKRNTADSVEQFKMESIASHLEIINKHLFISLLPFDGSVSAICSDCLSFVEKLETFKVICLRTQEMFQELIQKENELGLDPESLRSKYGFDSEKNSFDDPYSDPLHSEVEFKVKEEEPVVEATPTARKRGRPRKSKVIEQIIGYDTTTEDVADFITEATTVEDPIKLRRSTRDVQKAKRLSKENICEFCFKKFTSPCFLRDHIWTKHRKQDRPFVCSKCEKRFPTKRRLQNHMTTHLPDELRLIHPCPYCDMKFSQKNCVKIHIAASHNRDNIWICEECGKSCNSKGALNQHKDMHIKVYDFPCDICPKKFKSSLTLKRHQDCHKDEVFICPECGQKLKSKRTLRTHMLVHLDTKKHKCNYCGNEFKRQKTLKNHLLLHSGLRPYECQFCDKTFTFGSSFRVHQKKVHPVELAAMEASGKVPRVTKMPRLDQLQPKVPVVVPSSSVE